MAAATTPENEHPVKAYGYAARDSSGQLFPFEFSRRATGEKDVAFNVSYCSVSRSDLVFIKNEWGNASYPAVPGHELVGIVTEVGSKVTKFKVGDRVGIGCLVDSCRSCTNCADDKENYCPDFIPTYGRENVDGTMTYGGYSNFMVCDEHFVIRIPNNMPFHGAAPLLCDGIMVYSSLRHYGLDKPGMHVGVAGLGGLARLAIKFGKAMGMKVTVISTSPNDTSDGTDRLGADAYLISRDEEQMLGAEATMDGIIDTVSEPEDLLPLLQLLKTNGKFIMVGIRERSYPLYTSVLIAGRKMVGGSGLGGGLKETQEMIDFAAEHNIAADVEVIAMYYVNTAMELLEKEEYAGSHFVIDVANTLKKASLSLSFIPSM